MPPLLRDIVTDLVAAEPGVEVVARIGPRADLVAAVKEARADVVVTSAGEPEPESPEPLLYTAPRLRVLTLADGGRMCHVDRLVVKRDLLRDVSPEGLIDAILDAGGPCPKSSDS